MLPRPFSSKLEPFQDCDLSDSPGRWVAKELTTHNNWICQLVSAFPEFRKKHDMKIVMCLAGDSVSKL